MIKSRWKFGKDEEISSVRKLVNDTFDIYDEKSMQLVMYEDDIPVGCASLFFDKGCYHIAHMCVVPELQHRYIGDLMIRLLIVRGFGMMADELYLTANKETVAFFERYGFKQIDASYNMTVTRDTVIMNSKCGHDCTQCLHPCK